jgi:hypothetical protein
VEAKSAAAVDHARTTVTPVASSIRMNKPVVRFFESSQMSMGERRLVGVLIM